MYCKLLSMLFFLFFTCVGLSPSINGISLYLYLIIPIFDINFLKSLNRFRKNDVLIFIIFNIFLILIFKPSFSMKIIVITYLVLYLNYLYEKKCFYLNTFNLINILIAIIQYTYLVINRNLILNVKEINAFLYGKYAMPMGNPWDMENPIFLFRVSALSKEPGFFSVLLIFSFLVNKFIIKNKKMDFFYLIGIILSFSKITLAFYFVYFLTILLKKIIAKMNKICVILLTLSSLFFSINYLYSTINKNTIPESIVNRTISYIFIKEMTLKEYLYGYNLKQIYNDQRETVKFAIDNAPLAEDSFKAGGFITILIENGFIVFLFFLMFILNIKLNSYYLLLYIAVTTNVNPLTISSFSILGVFFVTYRQKGDKYEYRN